MYMGVAMDALVCTHMYYKCMCVCIPKGSQKAKLELSYDRAAPLPGIYPTDSISCYKGPSLSDLLLLYLQKQRNSVV